MEELRKFTRYFMKPGFYKSAFVEIDGINKMSGTVSDLSTGGFSFFIDMKNNADSKFELGKYLFVMLYFDEFHINAEVEKKWSFIKNENDEKLYTAGVSFKVISNEDRLRLNEIIGYLRIESSAYHCKINN